VHETLIKLIPIGIKTLAKFQPIGIIVAPQQLCNILHKINPSMKGSTMFDFTKQTKQYEELAKRIQEVNEFWINAVISSAKEFFNTAKTK